MGLLAPLHIVGAGAMGRETLDVYRALGRAEEVTGFVVEDAYLGTGAAAGLPVEPWSKIAPLARGRRFVVAIGSRQRLRVVGEIAAAGGSFDTAVHPGVAVAASVRLGEGCIVLAGTVFTVDIVIGPHTIVNAGCTISHDVSVGRGVTLSPGVHVAGHATIEDEAFLGVGAIVVDRVRIGRGAIIGAGAVVTRDVTAGVTAVGVPARPRNA